jgi:hypothetical protein
VVAVVAEEVAVVDTPDGGIDLVVATEVDTIIKILDRRPPIPARQPSSGTHVSAALPPQQKSKKNEEKKRPGGSSGCTTRRR